MYPRTHALEHPDRPAVIMARSGRVVTYAELDRRSSQLAQLLRNRGLRPGDGIAIWVENNDRFFELVWAAQRSGLYYTPINSRLMVDEARFIIEDCGARALVVSSGQRASASELVDQLPPHVEIRLLLDEDPLPGWELYDHAVAHHPSDPIPDAVSYTHLTLPTICSV